MIEHIAQKIALNDGNAMPGYGFGCYQAHGEELAQAISTAWQCGYRLYDTAIFYRQEDTVGAALKPYRREDFFLVSKIWPTDFDRPLKGLDSSLKALQMDYLDAYLLHWPGTDQKLRLKTYETLLRAREAGKIVSVGVSNFMEPHLEEIKSNFGAYPPIDQFECHPAYREPQLCAFCDQHKFAVMAWSPLGRGDALAMDVIRSIAQDLGRTAAQVILRWHVQENRIAIPKSVHAKRIEENAKIFDFSLTAEQMAQIDALDSPQGRRGADPMQFSG